MCKQNIVELKKMANKYEEKFTKITCSKKNLERP